MINLTRKWYIDWSTIRLGSLVIGWRALLVFILPFSLYIRTLAPTIYNLDSAELTTAAATGGLMRATGYPLYLTVGHLWSKLPIGDVGYRMNLFSALAGAVSIALLDRILRKLGVGPWAALGSLALLATAPFFWGLSLIAEVYTLHTALMAGLILALLNYASNPGLKELFAVSLLMGLSLSHHAASVLLVPGSVLFVVFTRREALLSKGTLIAGSFGLVLGLSFYLYLPLRYLAQPIFNYAGVFDQFLVFHPIDLTRLDGLWWLVSGKAFQGLMMSYQAQDLLGEFWNFLRNLWQAFLGIGIGPGILGAVSLWRSDWKKALMLSSMFFANTLFYINYRVMDKETMFLPSYLIWAIWTGIGFQILLRWLNAGSRASINKISTLFRVGVLMTIGFALAWNWQLVDLSSDYTARVRGEGILNYVEQNAIVLGYWDTIPVVQYLQLVEGKRPDVTAINRFLISHKDLDAYLREEVGNKPIFIDSKIPQSPKYWVYRVVGPVYQIIVKSRNSGFTHMLKTSTNGTL